MLEASALKYDLLPTVLFFFLCVQALIRVNEVTCFASEKNNSGLYFSHRDISSFITWLDYGV
ncbi:hypothetical protein B4064_0874 [Caldibacillus thermoamylovorans]|jgi:hypothetical protein|nr:hypothetical protein B4064_0874 [Caldibacillus thermoamylovorans]